MDRTLLNYEILPLFMKNIGRKLSLLKGASECAWNQKLLEIEDMC